MPPVFKETMPKPLVSIVIVNSRGDKHDTWVKTAIDSATQQNIPVEVIVVDNIGRRKTIGKCFNQGVEKATTDYVFFLGDDDYVSFDICELLYRWANSEKVLNSRVVCLSTYMTTFNDETGQKTALTRQHTGMWKRDYLVKFPFNEELERGIDREYIEETVKRGDLVLVIEYYFGYFYRRHKDYRCAGDIIFEKELADYYFVTSNRIFLNPITDRISKLGKVFIDNTFTQKLAEEAKVIWCEWANEKAVEISNLETKARKILRLHAYEAFSDVIKRINLKGFDKIIFIDDYIKEFVEKQYGKLSNAVVIPNGVQLEKFTFNPEKKKNNKIAYAGYLTRKKGIGELLLIAKSLPQYEFHLAGRYQEDDIADWMNTKKPDNVFIDCWQYNINEWYQDKSFIINTSMRESQAMTVMEAMSCGLKPVVNEWIGSEDIYGKDFVYKNIEDIKRILEGDFNPSEYRKFVEDYSFEKIYPKIEELILEEIKV